MHKREIIRAVLDHFQGDSVEFDVADSGGVTILDIKFPGVGVKFLVRIVVQEDSGEVRQFGLAAGIGSIYDRLASESILRRNAGGVKGSPFYFSVMRMGDYDFLFLETKLETAASMKAENAVQTLIGWLTHPLFTRKWDFPEGVDNYLWGPSSG